MKILTTGGAGFIGTSLCKYILAQTDHSIVNVDKLTYAADKAAVEALSSDDRYQFFQVDICDYFAFSNLVKTVKPHAIMHLAAESHVDRSIEGPGAFIQTNLIGTYNVLEAARDFYESAAPENFRFHHISTDEVYGTLGDEGAFTEDTSYDPRSPYSASKAGSDHLVRAWHETYGLPVVITNCSNNYGPHQYPEKLIPVIIREALAGNPIPIYGQGLNIRDWLFVEDHAEALICVLEEGQIGESYNIGGETELRNIDLVEMVCEVLDMLVADSAHIPHKNLISFVEDRKGHDYRYAMDISKIKAELDWSPVTKFKDGILKTVQWYLDNPDFLYQKDAGNPSLKTKQGAV